MDRPQVIMPVYLKNDETWKLTFDAINSLGDVDLIIIDNDSDLRHGEDLREMANLYIRNNKNLGYSKAVNQGLKLSHQGLVAVANNDIKVSPNWIEVAKEVFQDPTVYSLHPRMIDYDQPLTYGSQIVPEGKERWCSASFFVIHNQGKLLLYDENFLNSYDDWDYFKRVRGEGMKTCYTDICCYQHKHSSTQKQIPEHEENNQKNREYFRQKHGKYAEDLFAEEFPLQMQTPYWEGFRI